MTNVAASRKFRAKGVYFDDQHMLLCTADYRTLGLVNDMHGHNILKHQIMKRSTSEGVKMKNEKPTSEKVQVKKTEQINNSKQTDNRAPNRVKNEKNEAYQRANNTQLHSKIKFKLFSPVSSKLLRHRKKINVKSISITHISADEGTFIKTLSPMKNKKIRQFD